MKTIQPIQVKEAYEKNQVKPIRGTWCKVDENLKICSVCAFSALTMENKEVFEKLLEIDYYYDRAKYLSEQFELEEGYVTGFICGFDNSIAQYNSGYHKYDKEIYMKGYEDGQATWELVKDMAEIQQ